jgi:4-methyl-5(b-hydroxyethyl)-thiazole monophosphate biosynthesis
MLSCILIANGFEETEAVATIDILRRADVNVKVVGIGGKIIKGSHGISMVCDIIDDEFTFDEDLKMVILPGGMPGTLNLEHSDFVQQVITKAVDNDVWIGAICAAPSILGHRGMLKGKLATCCEGLENELIGAKVCNNAVCQDGKIITARSAGVVIEFALKLAEVIAGEQKSDSVKKSLLLG